MLYKGLFFENKEQLNKAKKLLKDNNLIFTEDQVYNQFYIQEAEAALDNLVEEYTDNDINELACYISEDADAFIDSQVVNEMAREWIKSKGYEEL